MQDQPKSAFPTMAAVLLANGKTILVDKFQTGELLYLAPNGVLQVLQLVEYRDGEPYYRALYTWSPNAWLSVRPADD